MSNFSAFGPGVFPSPFLVHPICLHLGGYHIDMEQIKEGLPPLKLTRIVKSVKYMLYWEFDTKESYGTAQKNLYESYWKSIEKCLVVPHDKYLGEAVF